MYQVLWFSIFVYYILFVILNHIMVTHPYPPQVSCLPETHGVLRLYFQNFIIGQKNLSWRLHLYQASHGGCCCVGHISWLWHWLSIFCRLQFIGQLGSLRKFIFKTFGILSSALLFDVISCTRNMPFFLCTLTKFLFLTSILTFATFSILLITVVHFWSVLQFCVLWEL